MTINRRFNTLDDARVVSILACSIEYCQVKVKKENYQVLVVNGVPFEYRTFCSLMICKLGGDIILNLRAELNSQILKFWKAIKYVPEGGYEKCASPATWDLLHLFSTSIAKVNRNTTDVFEQADYLEMMKNVSLLLHAEKQLRLADVNDDVSVA